VLLEERLRSALSKDARSEDSTGVLFLDLDGFKSVNDEHGHGVGDTVLRTIADRLVAAVRPSDTVARLGGDEFVVLVEAASEAALEVLVSRLGAEVSRPDHGRAPHPRGGGEHRDGAVRCGRGRPAQPAGPGGRPDVRREAVDGLIVRRTGRDAISATRRCRS
jgi:GGDEF domain-containing protein